MIKANELRIGNWIIGANKQLFKVDGYGIDMIHNHYVDAEPVPITTEILKKAGFESEDMADLGTYIHLKISIPEFYLSWDEEMKSILIGDYKTNVVNVHQLQNLYFALTGNELEITL